MPQWMTFAPCHVIKSWIIPRQTCSKFIFQIVWTQTPNSSVIDFRRRTRTNHFYRRFLVSGESVTRDAELNRILSHRCISSPFPHFVIPLNARNMRKDGSLHFCCISKFRSLIGLQTPQNDGSRCTKYSELPKMPLIRLFLAPLSPSLSPSLVSSLVPNELAHSINVTKR